MKFFQNLVVFLFMIGSTAKGQTNNRTGLSDQILTGAERLSVYLPMLKGKSVSVFANQTSLVGKNHLVDVLIHSGIIVKKIFAPEKQKE